MSEKKLRFENETERQEWLRGIIENSEQKRRAGQLQGDMTTPYWNGHIDALRRVATKFDIDVNKYEFDIATQKMVIKNKCELGI